LTGPFGVMLHEPALGAPLQELGSAIRYASGLSAHAFCLRLLDDAGPAACLDDDTYATYAAVLGTTTMTELVVLVGYYRTLAQLLDVFDVGVPGDQ
jgi:4-carboxymuconolactone decarboxylase